MLFAMAAIVGVCFALGIGLVAYGMSTWFTRKGKGDTIAATFFAFGGLVFMGAGIWAFLIFRHTLLVLGGIK